MSSAKLGFLLLKVLISFSILYFLATSFKFNFADLLEVNFLLASVASILLLVQPLFVAKRIKTLAAVQKRALDLVIVSKLVFVGLFFNNILPAGTGLDLARFYFLRRFKMSISEIFNLSVADRMIALAAVFSFFPFSVYTFVLNAKPEWEKELAISQAHLFLIIGLAFFSFILYWIMVNFSKTLTGRLMDFGILIRKLHFLLFSRQAIFFALPLSIFIHLISALCMWFIFKAHGTAVDLTFTIFVFPIVIISQMLPISLNGWGVREAVSIYLFGHIGVEPAVILSCSILFGVLTSLISLFGMFFIFADKNLIINPIAEEK